MELHMMIVEDQNTDAERLERLLKQEFEDQTVLCRRFFSGDEFLRFFTAGSAQAVFLDICMEGTNGIETAQILRQKDPSLLIVFVTSSPEYVWDAFPVHPFDYLLKPYDEDKFHLLAGELRRMLCRREPELSIKIARKIVQLPVSRIHYALSQNHTVQVMTDDGECRAADNFAQVEQQLIKQDNFLTCNRGIVVNMDKILRFNGDFIEMLDGAHLPVRQKDKTELLSKFTQYQFRHMRQEL